MLGLMLRNPWPDGRYHCRIFADSEPVLREKRGGRWYLPGAAEPIRVATNLHEPFFMDGLYAEVRPAEAGGA